MHITRKSVTAFFKSKGRKSVGTPGEPRQCALVTYLRAQHPKGTSGDQLDVVSVDHAKYYTHKTGYRDLPLWAQRFVEKFDALEGYSWVSGTRAAKILGDISLTTRGRL